MSAKRALGLVLVFVGGVVLFVWKGDTIFMAAGGVLALAGLALAG